MKKVLFGFILSIIITGTILLLQNCSVAEERSNPAPAACNAWIESNHSLKYSNHGCQKSPDILKAIKGYGGGVIPIGANRFFIICFPDGWEKLSDRKLVVTLHGSGGCAESLFQFWYKLSARRKYAIAALQYAEEDSTGTLHYDDSLQIYKNLRAMLGELQTHCPLQDVPIVLHGFSRGSARTFELALLDRADGGLKAFSTFVSDSGTVFAENQGRLSPALQNAPADAYNGARFWLYCGGKDHNGQTCNGMERMKQFVLAHGGAVDDFHKNPTGGHGIFTTGNPRNPGQSLTALFDYIDAIGRE
jgi:predicted esterase